MCPGLFHPIWPWHEVRGQVKRQLAAYATKKDKVGDSVVVVGLEHPSIKVTFVTALDTGPKNNSFNTANTQTVEEACHHKKETQINHNSNTVSRY